MAFTLPALPYAYDALEPHFDAKTMEIHHSKHHNTYITNLNNAIAGTDLENKSLIEILQTKGISQAVINNAGGHANHSYFWEILSSKSEAKGEIVDAIIVKFGSLDKFKEEFKAAATSRFGSGWAFLVLDNKELKVISTANQDSPIMQGQIPLIALDVWEHAYYLKYQNLRPSYIDAFWNVLNWQKVNETYLAHK